MVLDPADRSARFFSRDQSTVVAEDGRLLATPRTSPVARWLARRGLVERSDTTPSPAEGAGTLALSAPLNVTIQVTNGCNLTCPHCHDPGERVRYLAYDDFARIIADLRAMRVFNVNLSGGEAMLHPRILDMVDLVWSSGLKVTMSSNCVLIDVERARQLAQRGLRQMHVSLDSHIPANHDRMRGMTGAFDELIGRLPNLTEAGIEFTLVTTLQGQASEEYAATIDKAYELGASAHKTNSVVPQGRATAVGTPNHALVERYIEVFRRKQSEYEGRFRLLAETMFALQMSSDPEQGAPEALAVGCPAGVLTCAINERGDVMPCSFFTEVSAGNAIEHGFRSVWTTSDLFAELRDRSQDDVCCSCGAQPTCGGCRARSHGLHGRLHGSDPHCSLAGPNDLPTSLGRSIPVQLSRRPDRREPLTSSTPVD